MWCSENSGSFDNALTSPDPGRVGCFCEYCQAKAKKDGIIDFARVHKGYLELEQFLRSAASGKRPVDGYYVTLWRTLLRYPEILAWEQFWHDNLRETYALLYQKIKSIRPAVQVGWHIKHSLSFSPYYRAQQDVQLLAPTTDFLKMVMYHNCGGPRMASYIHRMSSAAFADLPEQQMLEFEYRVMNYQERSYAEIPFTGLSSDYVLRETKRCVEGAKGTKTLIWPGIDIDIPTQANETKVHSARHSRCRARRISWRGARSDSLPQVLGNETRQFERRRRSYQAITIGRAPYLSGRSGARCSVSTAFR